MDKRNGLPVLFADWIVSKRVDNVRFLQKAESYPNKCVKLIYHMDFEDVAEEFVANLHSKAVYDFSHAVAMRVLGSPEKNNKRLATYNKQANHAKKCAKAIEMSKIEESPVEQHQRTDSKPSTRKMHSQL